MWILTMKRTVVPPGLSFLHLVRTAFMSLRVNSVSALETSFVLCAEGHDLL
jgi:hypothetical protein